MTKTRSLICLAALVLLLAAGTPMAVAQTYLGNFCGWYSEDLPPCEPSPGEFCLSSIASPLKAGITQMGGGYYLFQGRVTTYPLNALLFLQATGVVIGDEIWLNGTTAQQYDAPEAATRRGGTIQMQLSRNGSTLRGTFWSIRTDASTTDGFNASFTQRYITGGLFFSPCP